MEEKLTAAELAALPEKAKRDPSIVELYRKHDYLTAYALHTDKRVLAEGYKTAVGSDASRNNWDSHGELQRDFLISRGLKPEHCLLEVGCGAGRLARKITPYLEVGHYHGTDISTAALDAASGLAHEEGWIDRQPRFWLEKVSAVLVFFDFIWAYSVFTHLPPAMIEDVLRETATLLSPGGSFYWTYYPTHETVRYGLMQFRATEDVYRQCAERAGLTFEKVPDWIRKSGYEPGRWSGQQAVALSRHA